MKAPDSKGQVRCRGHIKKIDPVDKVISLLPSTEDYQSFGRKTKLLIHLDNIPNMNISLPSREQIKTINKQNEIGENYQVLCEESKTSSIETYSNNRERKKTLSEESEMGKNYQVSREEPKTSRMDRLNSVDCSIEEVLNEVNISLISASCPVKEQPMKDEHIELKSPEELVLDRLKSFLSSMPVVKANGNSGFSFFL